MIDQSNLVYYTNHVLTGNLEHILITNNGEIKMAYMSQDTKKSIAPKIQKLAKEYGIKCTLALQHHSTIILNINSGKLDFIENYNAQIREANKTNLFDHGRLASESDGHIQIISQNLEYRFTGDCLAFLERASEILYSADYYNNSDSQIDYFDVAYYVKINIGRWDKPCQHLKPNRQAA